MVPTSNNNDPLVIQINSRVNRYKELSHINTAYIVISQATHDELV